ncbi:hypothetical protein [Pseudomonas sp. 5P_3.1_Bac2]|uniref:hypothetical protein n=1 Tax=Pseudomonas sp. 5P_3.1_Bac2 TaxID=2971617 RepID=UPI0021CAA5FC|nr:hypothetical protein [Pseudomonas sp. 5P_3.1_Bac2]MCU1717482.1 hypothetical protein [Pseudomonas sp. 5P_3.1_Bac2]
MHPDQLVGASLGSIKALFAQLQPAPVAVRQGFFRAGFVGPWWLRASAGPSIYLSGLPGWQGKRFLDSHTATNILLRNGQQVEKLRMTCQEGISAVDGRLGVALVYPADAPIGLRWVRDELRQLDEQTLLGMTVIDLPLLRRFAFPFVLRRSP